jgi:hypothetical protein
MLTRFKTAIEVAIVLAVGAAVYFVPGGGNAARGVEAALSAVFGAGFVFAGIRLYRERSLSLYSLGERRRGLVYAAAAIALVGVAAQPRMFETGVGELCWFVLMGFVVYTVVDVVRHARSY